MNHCISEINELKTTESTETTESLIFFATKSLN